MQIDHNPYSTEMHIKLSRRNVENLLIMLDDPEQASATVSLYHSEARITIEVEENIDHYSDVRPPGLMSWDLQP